MDECSRLAVFSFASVYVCVCIVCVSLNTYFHFVKSISKTHLLLITRIEWIFGMRIADKEGAPNLGEKRTDAGKGKVERAMERAEGR